MVDEVALAEFLSARARESDDEEREDLLAGVAEDLSDSPDSKAALGSALYAASWYTDHPDYRPEWRV